MELKNVFYNDALVMVCTAYNQFFNQFFVFIQSQLNDNRKLLKAFDNERDANQYAEKVNQKYKFVKVRV